MNVERIIEHLTIIEQQAQCILNTKSEIVSLDRRRHHTREGLRSLQDMPEKSVWIEFGPVLMKFDKNNAKELMERDQKIVDIEINKLRSGMKEKVSKLQDLEYNTSQPICNLKPLSKEELAVMKRTLR